MVDIVDMVARSRNMSRIRSKNTKPELKVRKALHARGLRFRLHLRSLPGTPDIVLPRWKAIVEVQGCFFHRHAGCRFATTPDNNRKKWLTKFDANVRRDMRNRAALNSLGWRVAVVWECTLKRDGADAVGARLADWLDGQRGDVDI